MALQDLPINYIATLLAENPDQQVFIMSDGKTYGPTVARSVLQNELNNRPLPASVDSIRSGSPYGTEVTVTAQRDPKNGKGSKNL